MNKLIINAIIASLALLIFLPVTGLGQEKKVHIKTVKVVDGEKVVTDTVFLVKEVDDEKDVLKTFTWISDEDSAGVITIDVEVESDVDSDSHKKVMIFKSGKDGNATMTHSGKANKYVIKIHKDEDGDFHGVDMDEFHEQMEEQKEHLKNIRIELDGEKIIMLEELMELEELKELKEIDILLELEALENMNIIIPEIPEFHNYHNTFFHDYHGHDFVSDKELRDAGIKNKADRLEADNFDINVDDGIVDLAFTLKTEGTPKVTVFNYFGDKVFSGKPELMNDKYVIKIDLSAKQHGTYFLQVIQKNSSFTKKLRL